MLHFTWPSHNLTSSYWMPSFVRRESEVALSFALILQITSIVSLQAAHCVCCHCLCLSQSSHLVSTPGPEIIKVFFMLNSFIMLIIVTMPTIAGILAFISMINTTSESLKARQVFIFSIVVSIISFMGN